MAVAALALAILLGISGDPGNAAFAIVVAAASVGFAVLAGRMKKTDKARADLFPPTIR
ncbi:hypothetical protein [Brevundimonas intermedia]|uniref:hypothetical protein n=1 Tax=Brevundimonas intermedia TaxID=74315 RepID=UPI001431C383|nr:hypothetical protein [Brevundimonas intermedia]